MTRFLGGHPVSVAVRLLLISLLVGWALRWLDVTPREIAQRALAVVEGALSLGVDGVARFGDTILLGAAVVIPVFLLLRLVSYRRG